MIILFLLSLLLSSNATTISDCLSTEEKELYELIMAYRKEKGLPRVELSSSLTKVAKLHVRDLQNNNPLSGKCNLHSWSRTANWKKCCYTDDHRNAECMWNKPKELTEYQGDGYEIAHWNSAGVSPNSAFEGWKKSRGHNEVMINKGIWKQVKWGAIGIGMYEQYAVVWFGKEKDPVGKPANCE